MSRGAFIYLALFITASGFADSYAQKAADLSLLGARGATSTANALIFANTAAANAKAAKDQKEKDAQKPAATASPAAPAESKFQTLNFDSNLPTAINSVSAPAESNVISSGKLPSGSSTGGNLLGNLLGGYTQAISEGGKAGRVAEEEQYQASLKATEDDNLNQIVSLTLAANKEIKILRERRAARAAFKEKTAAEENDKLKTLGDKLKAMPTATDRSPERELAKKGDDKMSLKGITAIPR